MNMDERLHCYIYFKLFFFSRSRRALICSKFSSNLRIVLLSILEIFILADYISGKRFL